MLYVKIYTFKLFELQFCEQKLYELQLCVSKFEIIRNVFSYPSIYHIYQKVYLEIKKFAGHIKKTKV